MIVCALCGFDTFGDFYIGIPGHWGFYMHSIQCGAIFVGQEQAQPPSHVRRGDGTFERLVPTP